MAIQPDNHEELVLLSDRPGTLSDLRGIMGALEAHRIRGQWFAPSPEVLAVAMGAADVLPARLRPGARLSEAQVLEVFRAAHETGLSYAVIGARYGVSHIAVGLIARGQTHARLFRRTAADSEGAEPGVYYVSEAREGAARYRMLEGKRGAK